MPLPPTVVERIRGVLLADGRLRDATLVSVLAYAGLRPGEALALMWGHVRQRTLLIESAVSLGELRDTKTGQRRTVRVLAPLAHDLNEWRLACGRPSDEELVFPDRRGGLWTAETYRNWRRRIYTPAAVACRVTNTRPYDLRHSFVSLLIHEGRSVVDVARQAGHSPTMSLDTTATSSTSWRTNSAFPRKRSSAGPEVARTYPFRTPRKPDQGAEPEAQCRTRTGDPFLTMEVLYQLS